MHAVWVAAYKHGRDVHPLLTEFPNAEAFLSSYQVQTFPVVEHKMSPKGVDPKLHPPCSGCAPSWSPIRADYRNNASVLEVWALVLDWDDVEDPAMLWQAASPFFGLVHTSINHYRKPKPRLRGIFPYSKPIPPARHPKVFTAYQDFFGTRADPVAKAPSAQFYIGRLEGDPLPAFFRTPGVRYLDPWQLPGADTFTREDILNIAKKLERSQALGTAAPRKRLGERFRKLYDGTPIAEPVELGDGRDDAAFKMCSHIAENYPLANPERVAVLFAPSLQAMAFDHPEGALTHEKILDMLYRLYSSQSRQEQEEETFQKQFWTAHGEPERVGTYLPSELEAMGNPGAREWIYQAEHGIYIRTIKGFDGPVKNATTRARQALSVVPGIGARDFGPVVAIASTHGTPIANVQQSLRAQRATFDPATRVLKFAPTPRRALEPDHSAFVDRWFAAAFTPEDRANVEAWLTLLPDLSRALSCLMLVGETDTGKNLFVAACTRFWLASAPASARRVLGRFGGDVLSCPLIWADEELPKGPDKFFPLEDFMHLTGAADFSVEQKGIDAITKVEGYTRWIATANKDLFTSAYSHASAGNEALAKRVLRVEILPESTAFLKDNKDHLSAFIESSELARHVLSLPVHQSKERFGIVSPPEFERTLAVSSTWGSRICQVVITALLKKTKTDAIIVESGRVWINGARLSESWQMLSAGNMYADRPKDARQITECLGSLCIPVHKSRKQFGPLKYRELDMAKLKHWAEQNDWATAETIDAAITPQGVN